MKIPKKGMEFRDGIFLVQLMCQSTLHLASKGYLCKHPRANEMLFFIHMIRGDKSALETHLKPLFLQFSQYIPTYIKLSSSQSVC